jgi:hypothetical protein
MENGMSQNLQSITDFFDEASFAVKHRAGAIRRPVCINRLHPADRSFLAVGEFLADQEMKPQYCAD